AKPLDHCGRYAYYYDYLKLPSVLDSDRIVYYSMWESTGVPAEEVDEINGCVFLMYVPCRQNADSYRASGVRVPIKVLHHGVDAQKFPLLERGRRERFTFGTFGDFQPRKGIGVLVRACLAEISAGDAVRRMM